MTPSDRPETGVEQSEGPDYDVAIGADELLADLAEDAASYGEQYEYARRRWHESIDRGDEFVGARYWMQEYAGGRRAYGEALAKIQPGGRHRDDDGAVHVRGFMRFLSSAADDCHDRSHGAFVDTRGADEGETAFCKILSTLRNDYGIGWPRLDDLGGNALECDLP